MKRASYIVLTLLVVFCLLSVVPFEADAAGTMTLEQLQEKFPNGSYWNHYVGNASQAGDSLGQRGDESFADTVTSSPCASHSSTDPNFYVGKYDCNYFDGGWQCFGFARKLGYDAFGTKVSTWPVHSSVANIKPGDVIRFWSPDTDQTNGHSVFVIGVSGSIITVGEANLYNDPCKIRWGHRYDLSSAWKVEVYSAPRELTSNHVHNYNTFEFYWAEHPHYNCYSCSCGAIDANYSEPVYLSTCEQCRAEKPVDVSWTECPNRVSIGSTNAVLAHYCHLSGVNATAVSNVGMYLYDYKGTEVKYHIEPANLGTYTVFDIWFNMNDELGFTTQPGTTYQYKFFAVVNGEKYYSPVYSFQTTGTHSHQYDGGKVTTNPTCGKEGNKVYTCTTCGGTKTESIAKLTTHSYNSGKVTKAATCKETGVKTYTCTVCGGTKTETIAKLTTHSYNSGVVTKQPTCKETGVKTYTCTVCGVTKTETIAKLTTHSYDNGAVTKQPTCKEAGVKTYTCTVCGATKTETIAKLTTHSYDNGAVTKQPTCKETGVKTYTCTVCGDSYTEEIAKLTTHSYENGTCAVCGGSDPDYVPPTEPTNPTEPTDPTDPNDPAEPEETEPTEPAVLEEEKEEGGFFAAIAAFFEAIFRVLFFFLYL